MLEKTGRKIYARSNFSISLIRISFLTAGSDNVFLKFFNKFSAFATLSNLIFFKIHQKSTH